MASERQNELFAMAIKDFTIIEGKLLYKVCTDRLTSGCGILQLEKRTVKIAGVYGGGTQKESWGTKFTKARIETITREAESSGKWILPHCEYITLAGARKYATTSATWQETKFCYQRVKKIEFGSSLVGNKDLRWP